MLSKQLTQSTSYQHRATIRQISDNPEPFSGKDLIICVSVGQAIHYGSNLKATYHLLTGINDALKKKEINPIQTITLSVNGSLQRHNFWYFACNNEVKSEVKSNDSEGNRIKPLSDKELKEALKDVPPHITEKELARYLAIQFYPYARNAEKEYIDHSAHLLNMDFQLNIRLHRITFKIVTWDDWLSHSQYQAAYENLLSQYEANKPFIDNNSQSTPQEAFLSTTAAIFHKGNKTKIGEAAARMIRLQPALARIDFTKVAEFASQNYLFEECPVIPGPLWKGIHIIYPHPMTSAFKATAAMTNTPVNWHILNVKKIALTPQPKTISGVVVSSSKNLVSSLFVPTDLTLGQSQQSTLLRPTSHKRSNSATPPPTKKTLGSGTLLVSPTAKKNSTPLSPIKSSSAPASQVTSPAPKSSSNSVEEKKDTASILTFMHSALPPSTAKISRDSDEKIHPKQKQSDAMKKQVRLVVFRGRRSLTKYLPHHQRMSFLHFFQAITAQAFVNPNCDILHQHTTPPSSTRPRITSTSDSNS